MDLYTLMKGDNLEATENNGLTRFSDTNGQQKLVRACRRITGESGRPLAMKQVQSAKCAHCLPTPDDSVKLKNV